MNQQIDKSSHHSPTSTIRRWHGVIFFVLLCVDMATKYLFYDQARGKERDILHPALNTGISFSLPVPSVIIFTVIIGASAYITRLRRHNRVNTAARLLFLAGAIGNGVDRLIYHGVRDFLVFDGLWIIPGFIFNAADVFLNISIIFIIFSLSHSESEKKETQEQLSHHPENHTIINETKE